jgi:SAM-dependent methyltransferase
MDKMLEATAAVEDRHYWFRGLRRTASAMLDAVRLPSGSRIVDCGSGTGRNLDWLGAFGTAVGVELTPAALAVGRRRGRRLVRGTVTALPLADASVDLATSFDVLYCLDDADEARALREMWRVVKPGGAILINAAALDILSGAHSTLTREVRRYTPSRLRRRLLAAGFEVERLTFTNLSLFAPALIVRGLQRVSGHVEESAATDLTIPAAPINAALDLCLRIETSLLSIINLPLGTSLMVVARKPR